MTVEHIRSSRLCMYDFWQKTIFLNHFRGDSDLKVHLDYSYQHASGLWRFEFSSLICLKWCTYWWENSSNLSKKFRVTTLVSPWLVDSFKHFPLYLDWPYDLFWFCTLPTTFSVRVMWQKSLHDLITHIYQIKNITSCQNKTCL